MTEPSTDEPKAWYGRRGEWLVVIQFLILFGFILMPAWSPIAGTEWVAGTAPVRWGLLALCWGIAIAFGVLGAMQLREYLTPLPYPVDHSRLVRHGVYALVRHPLYSSQLFAAFGWVVYSLSLSHLPVLVIGFVFFDYKATQEERWLAARHPEYADYARRVRKLVPWIY